MAKIKLTTVAFNGTAEQEKKLHATLERYKDMVGGLMPAMQAAQEIYGYLPIEVQKTIADVFKVNLEEVFGISTFYSQFKLNPQGQYQVAICLGTACYVKGSGDILDAVKANIGIESGECTPDGRFSIAETRCIGCCGLAPVLTVNADVYGKLTTADVDGILAKYK